MASVDRAGQSRAAIVRFSIFSSCALITAANRLPSSRRDTLRAKAALPRDAVTSASRASMSASLWLGCATSRTPRRPIKASALSGTPPIRSRNLSAMATTCSNTASFTITVSRVVAPVVVRDTCKLPRLICWDRVVRTTASSASKPGGRRHRISSALPFTLLISHCQWRPDFSPEPCPNPVMLESVMSFPSQNQYAENLSGGGSVHYTLDLMR